MNGRNETKQVRITLLRMPPSQNEMRRKYRNVHAYATLRYSWEHDIYYSVSAKDRDWLNGMALLGKKMHVKITVAHKKTSDEDNLIAGMKPILDSLVRLKFLKDDSPTYCDLECLQEKINFVQTTIILSESQATEG